MRKLRSGGLAALLVVLLVGSAPGPALADRVAWQGFSEARKQAADSGKKLMVYFRTAWCGYCRQMENTTFEDKNVVAFLEDRFVPVKVDADKRQKLAADFRVQSYPTSWFLTPEGEKILFLPGYAPAEPFLQVLQFIDTESYLDMSFEEYRETLE